MITLSKSGNTVIFEFDENSGYLQNGTIEVPVNSLALIIDESDMATFRKAASNDIFVSANIAEFGMTKAELESWYKANMVGSTGGGGGVTSGEVQTMIDESISGKVDADFDNSLGFDINDDLGVYAEGNSEDIVFNTASSKVKEYTFPSVYTNGSNNIYKVGFNSSVELELNQSFSGTVSTTKAIGVKYLNTNDELKECWWDYSNNAFIINSDYSANNSVRLTYNSSIHKIALSRQNTSLKTIITIMVGGDYYIASSSNPIEADCYISYIKIYTSVKKLQSVLNEKQRQLTAGDGIKLDYYGNISANIKVTGDTYTKTLNSESATTYLNFDGIKNVDMWLNQSYTGTPSGWYTISVRNLDGSYDYYLYENDAFTLVTGSAGSTLNYDSSTGKLSITCPSGISSLQNNSKFAPKDDLTNADCFIGLVSYTSNEYPLQEAIDNKQDALTAGSGISIQNDVISVTGKVDTEDLDISGKTLYTKWYSSADYTWGQTYDIDSHPTAVVVRFTSTYSTSASPLIFVFSDGTTEATRTLSIVGDGAGNILSASFDSEFSNAVLSVVDGLLYITLTDGYYIKQLTMSSGETKLKYPSMSIESGSTPAVVEQGVYDVLEDLNDRANTAEAKLDKALQAEMYFGVGTSGLTITTYPLSGTSAQYKSVALDNSLNGDVDGVLGVYATGSTKHAVAINRNFNSTNAPVPEYLKPCYEVVMHKNPYYSGSAPTTRAIRVYYLDSSDNRFNQDYTYNSGTDSFTNATSNTGVTLTYDNVANTITLTLDPSYKTITDAGSNKGVAPSTAITNPPSYIGLVTIDSNSYKLQEALDNKVDASDVTTAVTSGSTDVVTSGGVYAKMGGMTIVKITESDYQSLSVKDPDTLYVVIPDPTNP